MTPVRRRVLLVFGGILIALLLAAVFRGPLLERFVVLTLRRTFGLNATIARVGGSAFGGLDLLSVSVRGAAGAGPGTTFEAERISARYSLAALLRGREAFLDSLDVTVAGARLELDLTGPPAAATAAGRPSFPRLPRLTVRDSRVRVRGRGFALEADGLQGVVGPADSAREQAVDLRAERFSLHHPALLEGVISLAVSGRYAPRRLAIAAARVNGEPLVERGSLELGERPGDGALQLTLGLWGGSAEIGVRRQAAGTDVRWDARGVDLQPGLLLANPGLGALRGRLASRGELRLGGGGLSTATGTFTLDWTGALLAGRAVDRLVLAGTIESGIALVGRAEGRIGANEVQVHHVSLPAGDLFDARWRPLLGAASGAFTATLGDVPAFLALWGVRAGDRIAAVPRHLLRLEGSLEKGRIRLARGDLAAGRGKATLTAVTVDLPREDQGWGETAFSGEAAVDVPDLREVSALFPMPPVSGSLRGEISGTGTFARPEGRASLSGRRIGVAGKTFDEVDLQARGTAGTIEIGTLQVRQGKNRLGARDVRFKPAAVAAAGRSGFLDALAGSFTLSAADLPALAALAGIAPETASRAPAVHLLTAAGTVRGRAIDLTGSFAAAGGAITLRAGRVTLPPPGADVTRDTTVEGDLEVDLPDLGPVAAILRLPPLQGALSGRARIAGSAGAPSGSAALVGRGIAIRGHRVGDVVVKATADRQQVRIESLEVSRGADRLRGNGSFSIEKGTLLAAEADLSVADVAPYLEEYVRAAVPVSGRLHLALRQTGPQPGAPLGIVAEFSGGRIGSAPAVSVAAEAQISLQGSLRQPRIGVTARATVTSDGPAGRPFRASLDATYEPGLVRIAAFDAAGAGGLAIKGEGTVPADLAADRILSAGPISIRAQASIPALADLAFLIPPAYAFTGSLRADIGVTGTWAQPEVRLEVLGERLQPPPGTRFAPPGPATLAGTLTWGTAEARAEKLRLESPSLSCTLSGTWSSPPSLRSLLAGGDDAAKGSLSLRTSFSSPDIGWLGDSVRLRRLHGSVAGEIAVEGPARGPAVTGAIRVADVALRYRQLPPIDALAGRAAVAGRVVTLDGLGGNVGGAPFTLSGTVDFSRLDDPILDLRLRGTNVLLYREEGMRVRANSDLTLRGPVSALSLAGEVALTDSLYQKNFSVARLFSGGDTAAKRRTAGLSGISFPRPPLRDMRFDVRIVAREPLQIRTNLVRGGARPDLRLTGTGLLPILRGPILVDTARVLFPSGALEVERGTVLYRESDPDRPTLDFGGRMHTGGYDITVQIGGTLDSPEVILASSPPLPREELLLLVLTGAPPESAGTAGDSVSAMASPLAVYFGRNVLEQLLGGGSPDGRFDLQERIDLQVGRELTRSGSVTVDARLLLKTNPLAHDSALYFTSEKDVYDQYNAGLKVIFKFK